MTAVRASTPSPHANCHLSVCPARQLHALTFNNTLVVQCCWPSPIQTPPFFAVCRPQVRKQAEDALKILSQQPNIIPELLQRVQGAEDVRMRHLAAVLLRKRISRHWESLPAEVRGDQEAVALGFPSIYCAS